MRSPSSAAGEPRTAATAGSAADDRGPRGYLDEMARGGYRPEAVGPFHRRMVPWLLERHGVPREGTVVDVGAGQGHGLIPLAAAGWRDLVAVDRDPFNFERFRTELGCRTLRCDVAREPLSLPDASAAAVLSLHLIEHLPDPSLFLAEIHRILAPGAPLFLVTPDWRKQYKTFYRDPTHVRPYDRVSLARLLAMHGFESRVGAWKSAFGLGRIRAYRLWPRLGAIGSDLLAVARRPA